MLRRPSEAAAPDSKPPSASDEKRTLTDVIVVSLTQDIVANRLAPGEGLDEGRLGRRFGASRTPVREALRQLAASGMVELRPHRTPLVARVDGERLAEMFDVMAELEALCAARASSAMSAGQRADLAAHHAAMAHCVRRGETAAYRAGNAAFHARIYAGAGNAYLEELALSTRKRLAPYRAAQLEALERLARSHAEHAAILDAIARGDGERASRLMREHLSNTRDQLISMARR